MALKKDFEITTDYVSVSGDRQTFLSKKETISDAYIKIESVRGDKTRLSMTVSVSSNDERTVATRFYTFTPSVADGSENFLRQGYEYLKTLPEFAGAADC